MQYKCEKCEDTGSTSKHLAGNLDCTSCSAATDRAELEKWLNKNTAIGDQDSAWLIHQRALAIGMSASVEDTLNEMQPGGALHMPQEPVAHLKFWAAQSWSGCGDHGIEHGEGLEVCEPGEIGADGQLAFPVFLHAIPGALAMAPKQEAPEPAPEIRTVLRDALASGLTIAYGCSRVWSAWGVGTMSQDDFYPASECDDLLEELCDLAIAALRPDIAAPAAANGALTDEAILLHAVPVFGEQDDRNVRNDELITFARAILASAGPDAAPNVEALRDILLGVIPAKMAEKHGRDFFQGEGQEEHRAEVKGFNACRDEVYDKANKAFQAALSGAKGN